MSEFVEYAYNDPCKFTKCELNSKCVNNKGIIKCVELCDLVKCGLNQKCVATNGDAECVFLRQQEMSDLLNNKKVDTTTTTTTPATTTTTATRRAATTTTTTTTTTTRKPRKPKQVQTNSALFPTIGLPKYWFPTIRFA